MVKYHYDMEQRSEDWYNIRLGKFTGSSFHVFLGNSQTKESKIYEKLSEIITRVADDTAFSSIHTDRGKVLEEEAVLMYEMQTGSIVTPVGFVEYDDLTGCSPDGLVGDDGMIEVKCHKSSLFAKLIIDDKIKPEYITQMQFNMLVCDRKWCDYVAYNVNYDLYVKRFYKDDEYQEKIKKSLYECQDKIRDMLKKYSEKVNKV